MLAQDQAVSFGPAIAALAAVVLVAGPLSVAVTYVVDFLRNLGDRDDGWPPWVFQALALLLGVGMAFGWGINLLQAVVAAVPALSDKAGTQNELGILLTGLLIGSMAGLWHDKLQSWSAWAQARRAVAPGETPVQTRSTNVK